MKIFDCFQFFDEDMMLDLRLNILNDYVDKFVIVENLYMHSGTKKKQNFKIENFKKFQNKIEYILVDQLPKDLLDIKKIPLESRASRIIDNTLKIEHNQRNKILEGIKDSDDNDLILISDVDEIPNLKDIKKKINKKIIFFKQKIFYYKFNLKYSGLYWTGTKGILKKNLKSPQWLRDVKDRKYPIWRLDILFNKMKYNNVQFIEDGGWHFSYLKDPINVEKKLKSIRHHIEYDLNPLGVNKIDEMIKNKKLIYNYGTDQRTKNKFENNETLNILETRKLPKYIQNNVSLYSKWLET